MNREALKFIDVEAFLSVMNEQGLGSQARAVIFENGQLPYCSAYFVLTELLPAEFDLTLSVHFGATLTQVQEVNYLGTEQYFTDFMIYPLSMTGYVEIDGVSPITFADEKSDQEQDWKHMIYVINLEDGGGKEFFLTVGGGLIGLSSAGPEQPQEFKTYKLTAKRIDQLKPKYPATCQLYAVERREFDKRRQMLQEENEKPTGDIENQPE